MSCHKKDILRELSCTHSRFRYFSYYLNNPYFTFYKRKPFSLLGCKKSTEKQSPNRVNPYRSKAKIPTEGYQVSPKRQPRKHQQKLNSILSAQKLQNLQQWQERDALELKEQKLRQFIQNYDKAIKEWQIKAIAEKQDFVGKISQIKQKKVKAFSMKKKAKEYNPDSNLSAEKQKRKLKETKTIIEPNRLDQTNSPKKTENKPKKLKTIQSQMYRQHLLNLIEINEKNERQTAKINTKITSNKQNYKILSTKHDAQQKRIQEQQKQLKKIEKKFSQILRFRNQTYYQQLNQYQNSHITPSDSKMKMHKDVSTKKVIWIDNQSPLSLQQQKISEKSSTQLISNPNEIKVGHQLLNMDGQSSVAVEKNEQSSQMNSKVTDGIVKIKENKHTTKLSNQKLDHIKP